MKIININNTSKSVVLWSNLYKSDICSDWSVNNLISGRNLWDALKQTFQHLLLCPTKVSARMLLEYWRFLRNLDILSFVLFTNLTVQRWSARLRLNRILTLRVQSCSPGSQEPPFSDVVYNESGRRDTRLRDGAARSTTRSHKWWRLGGTSACRSDRRRESRRLSDAALVNIMFLVKGWEGPPAPTIKVTRGAARTHNDVRGFLRK